MTGFGEATIERGGIFATVQIRSVNNKYFKLTARLPDSLARLEGEVEQLIRRSISRGTIHATINVSRKDRADVPRVNGTAITEYLEQLAGLGTSIERQGLLGQLLQLPGVLDESGMAHDYSVVWPVIESALSAALDAMEKMRSDEGRHMRNQLVSWVQELSTTVTTIDHLAPQVLADYRSRLTDRVGQAIASKGVSIEPRDLIREIATFADRADISEELTRLKSHAVQFTESLDLKEPSGRRLDFLLQEMFRETNTLGAKANDARISQQVVTLKCAIEQARELVQNVE